MLLDSNKESAKSNIAFTKFFTSLMEVQFSFKDYDLMHFGGMLDRSVYLTVLRYLSTEF